MFKSVFTKYLLAFALIILISFLILAWIISSMVRNYASDSKENEMKWNSEMASGLIVSSYRDSETTDGLSDYILKNKGKLRVLFEGIVSHDQTLFFLVTDGMGDVILESENGLVPQGGSVPQKVLNQIAEKGSYTEIGTLSDLFPETILVYAVPLLTDSVQVGGYVFLCSTAAEEKVLIRVMTETVIMSSVWVMLAAMIAVYFITDRMVEPLRTMTHAAQQFGKGNFSTRVSVSGSDEIAELGAAFNNMAESLDHLEMMRNSFLANVSHDLRTPMTTIAGFIDGINSGAIPPEKQGYYLNIISGEIHRLSRLVTELLDLSKLESGERKFVKAPFDICEMARLILISFEQKIDAKKLDVRFETDGDSMIAAEDKDSIYQVLYNLCDNAIKFSRDEGVFAIGIKNAEKRKITVSVYNEGKGIPEKDLPFVFDRFFKSDKSRGLDKTGSGLGLYIARTILEQQGERISVESVENEYCRFTFTLDLGEKRPRSDAGDPSERS